MAASAAASVKAVERDGARHVGFAVGIVFILTVLFLPLPAAFIDIGLVSASKPFLLSAGAELQFVADANAKGITKLSFKTWDKTFGTEEVREKAGLLSKATSVERSSSLNGSSVT